MNEQKKKRAVSAEGEGPATAETTYPLLVPSRLLQVREAWNHQDEGSLKIEKGGQGFRKSLPPLPGQYRWEGDRHNQPLLMYVHLCFRVGPPSLLLIRQFSNLSFPPFHKGLSNSCDSRPGALRGYVHVPTRRSL